MGPRFYKKRVQSEIRKYFPRAKIISHAKFEKGLLSPTFKVRIENPSKYLAIKLYKLKNIFNISKSVKVSEYLKKKRFPVPKIYSNTLFENQGILVMGYIKGENAMIKYNSSSSKVKQKIMISSGKILRRLHRLKPIEGWTHKDHDTSSAEEWIKWIKKRSKKYNEFFKENLDKKYYLFFRKELKEFLKILTKNHDFVPLHWDYHLANSLVDSKGEIVGLIDFDNVMKGHSFSDIGIAKYWLRFESKDYETFEYFLKGYGVRGKDERTLVEGYFLLHLMAVTRSLFHREDLKWIVEEHYRIFDELLEEKA